MAEFPTFKGSLNWPLIGSYCIPSCITHWPLPAYQISLKSNKLFVDKPTYGRTDIWHFIGSTRRSRPNNDNTAWHTVLTLYNTWLLGAMSFSQWMNINSKVQTSITPVLSLIETFLVDQDQHLESLTLGFETKTKTMNIGVQIKIKTLYSKSSGERQIK